jgi:hypothetical protein
MDMYAIPTTLRGLLRRSIDIDIHARRSSHSVSSCSGSAVVVVDDVLYRADHFNINITNKNYSTTASTRLSPKFQLLDLKLGKDFCQCQTDGMRLKRKDFLDVLDMAMRLFACTEFLDTPYY